MSSGATPPSSDRQARSASGILSWPHLARACLRILGSVFVVALIAVVAIDLAILIVPTQPVHLLGQTVHVGAVRPSFDFSGPAHVMLFSQTLDLMPSVEFPGLIRPLATLTKLSNSLYLGQLTDGSDPQAVHAATAEARNALIVGWLLYFTWLAAASAPLAGALGLLLHRGLTRHRLRLSLRYCGLAAAMALVVLGANVGLTYHIGRQTFTNPHLAEHLFSQSSVKLPPPASTRDKTTQIAVLGDSTESGEGLRQVAKPNSPERLCRRSPDSAAAQLRATGLAVANLACSGATIDSGIMGGQVRGGRTISPQLSALESMPHVKFIIIGVGADDVKWSAILKACIGLTSCDNEAVTSMFDDYLERFAQNYHRLLASLQGIISKLDHEAVVVIDQYYNPFGPVPTCTNIHQENWPGLNTSKVAFLGGLLDRLNTTLADGAKAAGFRTTKPDFTGNQLCDRLPFVQGLDDHAPFHPNALGHMKIALTNLAAFPSDWRKIAAGTPRRAAPHDQARPVPTSPTAVPSEPAPR